MCRDHWVEEDAERNGAALRSRCRSCVNLVDVPGVNLHTREISIKIVYYGPGLGGKTSSLQYIHRALKPDSRGQLVSLATGVDRTLYFDFLPVKLPKLRGYTMRVQLYTVPGQVHYNSTRKLVLTGADGVVFVADSQRARMEANVESMENLRGEPVASRGCRSRAAASLQYNKRDAPDALPVAELERAAQPARRAGVRDGGDAAAPGVFDALKSITPLVLADLRKKSAIPPAVPEEAAPIAAKTEESSGPLGEMAEAIAHLGDVRPSAPHRVVTSPAGRDLADLVEPGRVRDALAAIEAEIDRSEWSAAVRQAATAHRDLAERIAGSLAHKTDEAPALAALLAGVPAGRFLRFRELVDRAAQGGAVTSTDSIFALFFVTDLALRAEESRR